MRDELLKNVSRIVVKLGTGVLTDSRKQLDPAQMQQLVAQLAAQRQAGREIVLVSSGAVGAGMGALGYEKRPAQLAELQACAAVGQTRLMAGYGQLFAEFGIHVAQVLSYLRVAEVRLGLLVNFNVSILKDGIRRVIV